MQKYQSIITATNGSVIRNVPVTVLKEDGSPAEIFMDREGQVLAPNPLATDSRGVFYFYAKNGRYSLRTAADGVQITDADTVLLFDPDETASDGPIADAVRRAEDAAERAETALGDSGLQNMVQDAQDAAANAVQAVIDANQAVASIDAALIEAGEAKDAAQAAAQTASEAAIDAQAVKDSLLNYDGALSTTPEWSSVPAHVDLNLDTQAQALANRSELLRENQKRSPLHFATYAEASAAAATLPDGQAVESLDGSGRLSRFKVQSGALVFDEYAGDRIGAAVWTSGQYRTMKQRARDTYCILDGPGGADPTGSNDSTVAIREAIKSGARVEVPTGIFVWDAAVDPLGIVMTTPGQTLFGHGSGIAPGGLNEWGPARAFASRIMFTGTGQRLERTRREWRGSAADPTDPLMSAGVSVSAYGVNIENIAIDLWCDYTDMARYNYGADWDIAIHNMCWMGYREHNVATTGYWRRYGRLIENTALTRHISLPGYPVADWAIRGTDHTSLIFPYSRGPRVAIGVLGAKKKITGYDGLNPIFDPNYYDSVEGVVSDNRGSTGASDVSLHAPILFSAEHHSGWRVHEPRADLDYTLEPDTAAACLHVDGWANNALETRDEVNQGLTVTGRARFHTIEAFHIRLDRCNRVQLEGHIDYSGYSQYPDGTPVGNKSYGSTTGTINTRNVTFGAGWMSNPQPEYFSNFVRGWYNLSPETGNAVHRNINLNEIRQRDDGSASTHLGIRKRDTGELQFKAEDGTPKWRYSSDWIFEPYTDVGGDIGRFSRRVRNMFAQTFRPGNVNGPLWTSGSGSPEGVLSAAVGSLYTRTDGGASTTLYVKQSGSGNTGWVAK